MSEIHKLDPTLNIVAVYGGASYLPQERALSRGVDFLVGTPGRLLDHLECVARTVSALPALSSASRATQAR